MLIRAKKRGIDSFGSGAYNAPRDGGKRRHTGIDFIANAGDEVCSHLRGKVTKLGYPYKDDLKFRYVELQDRGGKYHRFFYIEPKVQIGEEINIGDVLGTSQNLDERYKGIPNHYHYEVCVYDGTNKIFSDPNDYLKV